MDTSISKKSFHDINPRYDEVNSHKFSQDFVSAKNAESNGANRGFFG